MRPYDGMRIARSEIARAANQAAFISAYLNPYVGGIDVVRSRAGDPKCRICPTHATIGIGGERLREPYSIHATHVPIYHPHCKCRVQPVLRNSLETVTQNLREIRRGFPLAVAVTPLLGEVLVRWLVGLE
jgi:hypothetical protein